MPNDDRPMDRRRFFREGLRELLKPLSKVIDPVEKMARHVGSLEEQVAKAQSHAESRGPAEPYPPPSSMPETFWLRPPGSLPEQQFRDTCSRCSSCVSVCPANAIKLDYSGENGYGVPYIDASEMACVICENLSCMYHCPSGAILPVPREQMNMGLAVWHDHLCVRHNGTECTICVDKCPVGATAIRLNEGRIEVLSPGCTGCGVCQHECPTTPKSITVTPRSAMGNGHDGPSSPEPHYTD